MRMKLTTSKKGYLRKQFGGTSGLNVKHSSGDVVTEGQFAENQYV